MFRPERFIVASLSACFLITTSPSFGVVRNDGTVGTPSTSSVEVTGGGGIGSGTIITRGGSEYVITAAHVTQFTGGGNGANYTFTDTSGATKTGTGVVIGQFNTTGDTPDWAMIKLSANFPVADAPVALYAGAYASGDNVSFTGYGLTARNAGSGLFTPNSTGTARQGANVINYVDPSAVGFDFDLAGVTTPSNVLPQGTINGNAIGDTDKTRADALGNAEATTFGGDSGMGYFITVSGTPQLYAVHDGITRGQDLNLDQAESYGTRADTIAAFLAVPEPGSLGLMGLGAVGVFARRRRGA